MGGYLMQLQNFSVNDGDGIRTVVFMASCPLRCAWCANPEGQTCCNAMTHWAETGDVLKKTAPAGNFLPLLGRWGDVFGRGSHRTAAFFGRTGRCVVPVSYTHLTLPTISHV